MAHLNMQRVRDAAACSCRLMAPPLINAVLRRSSSPHACTEADPRTCHAPPVVATFDANVVTDATTDETSVATKPPPTDSATLSSTHDREMVTLHLTPMSKDHEFAPVATTPGSVPHLEARLAWMPPPALALPRRMREDVTTRVAESVTAKPPPAAAAWLAVTEQSAMASSPRSTTLAKPPMVLATFPVHIHTYTFATPSVTRVTCRALYKAHAPLAVELPMTHVAALATCSAPPWLLAAPFTKVQSWTMVEPPNNDKAPPRPPDAVHRSNRHELTTAVAVGTEGRNSSAPPSSLACPMETVVLTSCTLVVAKTAPPEPVACALDTVQESTNTAAGLEALPTAHAKPPCREHNTTVSG